MMKFKNYLMGMAALALLGGMASCQSNDEVTPENQLPTEEELGTGYMAFSLNMPASTSTRANEDFDDGLEKEYVVEDIILALFSGTTGNEDDAVLVSAYNLSDQRNVFEEVGGTNQITAATVNKHLVAEVKTSGLTGTHLYAFVVLNDHQFIEVNEAEHALYTGAAGKLIDPATGTAIPANQSLVGKTFGQIRKMALNESGRNFAAASFFMCNAPVSTKAAANGLAWNDAKVQTLVEFDRNHIYTTKSAAESNPACVVNVERALAKVECTFGAVTAIDGTTIPVQLLNWDLDNTNDVTYVARQMVPTASVNYFGWANLAAAQHQYRFTSPDYIALDGHNHGQFYRTYWAEDVNYNDDVENFNAPMTSIAGLGTSLEGVSPLKNKRVSGDVYYTPENTFDVAHQTVKNTTRLIVAAKINDGKTFITLTENAKVLYNVDPVGGVDPYTTNGYIQKYLSDALANRISIREWAQTNLQNPALANWSDNLFRIELVDEMPAAELGKTGANIKNPGRKIAKISLNTAYANYKSADYATAVANFEAIKATQQAYLYESFPLHYYQSGIAYYQVLIKHFGDAETPWAANNDMINIPTGQNSIYGTEPAASENFLGRYGIVRNNWYLLQIAGVSAIGSSVVPPLNDDPDDNISNYMSVHVNILPWVKRQQTGIVL